MRTILRWNCSMRSSISAPASASKLPEGVFDMTTAVHGVYEAQTQ